MDLSPRALVTWEQVMRDLSFHEEDRDLVVGQINRISAAIDRHCNRTFRRGVRTKLFDACNEEPISLGDRPVYAIRSLRYDPSRAFAEETEIDPDGFAFTRQGKIDLPGSYSVADRVFRVEWEGGFSLVRFMQDEVPADPLPGDVWMDSKGAIKIFDGSWVAYFTEPLPDDVVQAALEYVQFIRRRLRAGDAGLVKRERGYSFEGSMLEYETSMPIHVRELLAPHVIYG